ncbi:MAG: 50S ribosomal protein L29 [Acidobacteriota bacterium]|jgi:large subunit ribosomal protein L29
MRASELRDKTPAELREQETELSEQLFALRLQKVTGQLENPSKIREVKRDLARVLTVLNEKQKEAASA